MKLAAFCGRTRSRAGLLFTRETLVQHQQDCEKCQAIDRFCAATMALFHASSLVPDFADEPDGAFWAIANELREGF